MLGWGEVVEGTLIQRSNRFLALVDVAGKAQRAFVANSGRLTGLMSPGARVILAPVVRPEGRTQLDLKLVEFGGILVSVDTRSPNDLFHRVLLSASLPAFQGYASIRREVTFQDSRFDFALDGPPGPCLVEVKSVTLVVNEGRALFPDAPTIRGAKHVTTLGRARGASYRAAVVFIIQREDAFAFSPNDELDCEFGKALRGAVAAGVEIYAYRCKVDRAHMAIESEVPVVL